MYNVMYTQYLQQRCMLLAHTLIFKVHIFFARSISTNDVPYF